MQEQNNSSIALQARGVQGVDSAFHWMNFHPVDNTFFACNTYLAPVVISVTLACGSCATSFFFLPHFDVIRDLLLNRSTATWNLFVNYPLHSTIHQCLKKWGPGSHNYYY